MTDRVLSIPTAAGYAQAAGFSGEALVTCLAIDLAESGLHTEAVNVNTDEWQSRDRGIAQFNDHWWPDISDACAFDPACAFQEQYRASKGGTDWHYWSTFNGGAYLQYVQQVRDALGVTPDPGGVVPKPDWTWIGTGGVNVWPGRRLPPIAIVAHIMDGTLAGCDSWFSSPAAQASANFGVGKNGEIHCYVDPDGPDAPYANGKLSGADNTVLALVSQMGGANPNYWTVSIEHEGKSGGRLTAAQVDASGHLAAWCIQRYGIPNDEGHLLGHYEFDSVTRAGCPGWDRQGWLDWEAAIGRWLSISSQPVPQPIPQPQPSPDVAAALQSIANARAWLDQATKELKG